MPAGAACLFGGNGSFRVSPLVAFGDPLLTRAELISLQADEFPDGDHGAEWLLRAIAEGDEVGRDVVCILDAFLEELGGDFADELDVAIQPVRGSRINDGVGWLRCDRGEQAETVGREPENFLDLV
jgi:hypothetical protein